MKKNLFLLMLCLIVIIAAGCADNPATTPVTADDDGATTNDVGANLGDDVIQTVAEVADDNVVEIREKMFIAQCNDIFLNTKDYMDKTIRLEGMYKNYTDSISGITYHYVGRRSPGCCGNDGEIGFEIFYDGEMPQINDWVEILGTVEVIGDDNLSYVVLRLSKLTVLDERGAEFVIN